ncbi:MAG TPA: SDR family NAD(P)-dependent oxidoreductase [Xanthobacteraceae bacterium]|nr:SDR family NAD(P)-dependent oxidoreductase [Xanthobacteraceae bacterium]
MPLRNPFDFTGKTVVLAGATGGFGRPISVAFAAGGANMAACARSEQALADLAAEVRGAGGSGEVMTAKVDLTVEHEVHDCVDAVGAKFGTAVGR